MYTHGPTQRERARARAHTHNTHTHIHHAHAHMRTPDTLKLVVAEEDAPEAIAFVLKKDSPEAYILKSTF